MQDRIRIVDSELVPDGSLNNAEQRMRLVAEMIKNGARPEEVQNFIPTDFELKDTHSSERRNDQVISNRNFWINTRQLQAEGLIPDKTFVFQSDAEVKSQIRQIRQKRQYNLFGWKLTI